MQSMISDLIETSKVQWQLTLIRFDSWRKDDVFQLKWWVLLFLFLVSITVWWITVNKSRLNELVLYAALICIIALTLDELGEELALWDYPTHVIPLFPPISSIDLASLPMVYSFIYQHYRTWGKFILATIIMALIFCFVFEPLLVLGGFYQTITWKYYYGFPIYSGMAILTKALLIKIYKISDKKSI